MIEFFIRLFARHGSGATAKERLQLVLMSDHLSLAPDIVEKMKRDLVDVISRYVEVDRERIDVHFEHQEKTLAMLANIPIVSVNRNGSAQAEQPPQAPVPPQATAPPQAESAQQAESVPQTEAKPRPKRKRRSRARKDPAASSAGASVTT